MAGGAFSSWFGIIKVFLMGRVTCLLYQIQCTFDQFSPFRCLYCFDKHNLSPSYNTAPFNCTRTSLRRHITKCSSYRYDDAHILVPITWGANILNCYFSHRCIPFWLTPLPFGIICRGCVLTSNIFQVVVLTRTYDKHVKYRVKYKLNTDRLKQCFFS